MTVYLPLQTRVSLLNLQDTTKLLNSTNNRLNSGLKVQSVADDPVSYFRARGLNQRADIFSERKDDIDQAISTMDATLDGVDSMNTLLNQMKGLINNMKVASTSGEFNGLIDNVEDVMDQYDKLALDASYNGVNLISGTNQQLEISVSDDNSRRVTVGGQFLLSNRLGTTKQDSVLKSKNPFFDQTLLNALRFSTDLNKDFSKIQGYTRLLGLGFSLVIRQSTNQYGYGRAVDQYLGMFGASAALFRKHLVVDDTLFERLLRASFFDKNGFNQGFSLQKEKILSYLETYNSRDMTHARLEVMNAFFDISRNEVLSFFDALAQAEHTEKFESGLKKILNRDVDMAYRAAMVLYKKGLTANETNMPTALYSEAAFVLSLFAEEGRQFSDVFGGHQTAIDLLKAIVDDGLFTARAQYRLDKDQRIELLKLREVLKEPGKLSKIMGQNMSLWGAAKAQTYRRSAFLEDGDVEIFFRRHQEYYRLFARQQITKGATPWLQDMDESALLNDFLGAFLSDKNPDVKFEVEKSVAGIMGKIFAPSEHRVLTDAFFIQRNVDLLSFWERNVLASQARVSVMPNFLNLFTASEFHNPLSQIRGTFGGVAFGSNVTFGGSLVFFSVLDKHDRAMIMRRVFKGDIIPSQDALKAPAAAMLNLVTDVSAFYKEAMRNQVSVNADIYKYIMPKDRSVLKQGLQQLLDQEGFDLGFVGSNGTLDTYMQAFYRQRFLTRLRNLTYSLPASFNENTGRAVDTRVGKGTTALKVAVDWLKKQDFESIYNSGEVAQEVQVALDNVEVAMDYLANITQKFGVTVSLLETRLDFTEAYVQHLKMGAGKMTLADMNEEGANMMSLQSRQSMGYKALGIAGRQEQNLLQLVQ